MTMTSSSVSSRPIPFHVRSQAYLRVQQQHRAFRAQAADINNVPPPSLNRSVRRSLVNVWHHATPPPHCVRDGYEREMASLPSCDDFSLGVTPLDPNSSGGGGAGATSNTTADSPTAAKGSEVVLMSASPVGGVRELNRREIHRLALMRSPDTAAEEGSVSGELYFNRELLVSPTGSPLLMLDVVAESPQQAASKPRTQPRTGPHQDTRNNNRRAVVPQSSQSGVVGRVVFHSTREALQHVVPVCLATASRVQKTTYRTATENSDEPAVLSARTGGKPTTPRRGAGASNSNNNTAPISSNASTPKRATYLDPTAASSARTSTASTAAGKRLVSVLPNRKWCA